MRSSMWVLLLVACGEGGTDPATGIDGSPSDTAITTPTPTTSTPTGWTAGTFCAPTTAPEAVADGTGWRVQTAHYDLWFATSQERAVELAQLAEASFLAFADYFQVEPPASTLPLVASIYVDDAAFEAAIAADGLSVPTDAGGYYHPSTQKVYSQLQPTQYYEDSLWVHELTHQFHYLARLDNSDAPQWYVEGLAEHLSRHDWDGECVRLGVIPLVSAEDFNSIALDQLQTDGWDVPGWLAGDGNWTRAQANAVVHWLDTQDHDAFTAFRDDMDAHVPMADAFADHLGDPADVQAEVEAWLPAHQEPFDHVFLEWQHRGPAEVRTVRMGSFFSTIRLKQGSTLSAVIHPAGGSWDAGVLISYDGPDDHEAVLVADGGSVTLWEVVRGVVSWNAIGTASSAADGTYAVSMTHDAGGASVWFEDTEIVVLPQHTPAAGLSVYGSEQTFSQIQLP